MVTNNELRKLLTDWKTKAGSGCSEIRAYGELADAAVNELPRLLERIDRAEAALREVAKERWCKHAELIVECEHEKARAYFASIEEPKP